MVRRRKNVINQINFHVFKKYFSAQREGLLSEAHSEEVDQADPFYAHCKLHTDKSLMRRRRRNYVVMQYSNMKRAEEHAKERLLHNTEALRIERKLAKKRVKYAASKSNAPIPWGKFFKKILIENGSTLTGKFKKKNAVEMATFSLVTKTVPFPPKF